MTKRILSILLSLIMMVGVFSVAAFAEPTSYDLYVNGELITSEKLTVKCGEGTATYDPAEKMLTLNNAEITESNLVADNYGIRAKSSDDLNIKLIGNNKINLPENGGIMVNDDVYIYGDGKLTMEVLWAGISAFGNVDIAEKAGLDIKANGGVAIASKRVYIDNSKVKAVGLDAGIDAATLDIKNSEAVLEATENERNAAFMRNENGITSYINIVNSKVKAKSYYPALFTPGSIIFDGGEAECISTDDSSIWATGNIVFRGGAKVNLEGKYPSGCKGDFYMSAAEVIAKNTSQENIPAIDYEREIAVFEDYHFTYAMAEDSEGAKIDLLERDETKFLNLYKKVHFKTEPIMLVYEIPFTKEVKLGGNTAPGKEVFELEIFNIGNGNAEAYKDVTVMAEVETNGAKKYMGKIVFSGPKYQFRELVSEGFYVREKNGGKSGWKYSDQVYQIQMERSENGSDLENYIIHPVKVMVVQNEIVYEIMNEPVKEMNFVNIYTENRNSTTIHIENPNRKPDEKNPNTGAPAVGIVPSAVLAAVLGAHK